ncbi:MAG: hypothetical protein ISS23_02400 [Nanoarchaeota archaeon]|nr:hypothetical protein [Nanoarchaeota archaeon]
MKLSKQIKGQNLMDTVVTSMKSLPGYEISIKPDINDLMTQGFLRRYGYKTDINLTKKQIIAHKYKKESIEHIFKGNWKVLYAIPIISWLIYAKEKSCSKTIDAKIVVDIDTEKKYDKLDFQITKKNNYSAIPNPEYKEELDEKTLSDHPNLKKDLEKLENKINEQLKA